MSYIWKHKPSGFYYYRDKKRVLFFSLKTKNLRTAEKGKKYWDTVYYNEEINNELFIRKSIKLKNAIDKFIVYREKYSNDTSKRTINNYRHRLGLILRMVGDQYLESITINTILEYISSRQRRNYKISWGTLRGDLKVWRSFMYWCKNQRGYIRENPFKYFGGVEKPVAIPKKTLSEEQIKCIWDFKFSNVRWITGAIRLLLTTGIRPTEAYRLSWNDINNDRIIVQTNKSKKYPLGTRSVALNSQAKLAMNSIPRVSEWIFPNVRDPRKHTSIYWFYTCLKDALRSIGAEHYSLNTFRNTFTETQVKNGVNVYDLNKMLGQYDLRCTMQYTSDYIPIPYDIIPE